MRGGRLRRPHGRGAAGESGAHVGGVPASAGWDGEWTRGRLGGEAAASVPTATAAAGSGGGGDAV